MLLLLVPALAGSDVFPEMNACLEAGNHTQLAINRCSGRRSKVYGARLEMLEVRAGWMGDESAFDVAAEAFQTFLTARCSYLGSFWEGGSGQPMIVNGCAFETQAWLAYRDAQCAWEESLHPQSKDACLAWHTEKRTAQLASDVQH